MSQDEVENKKLLITRAEKYKNEFELFSCTLNGARAFFLS